MLSLTKGQEIPYFSGKKRLTGTVAADQPNTWCMVARRFAKDRYDGDRKWLVTRRPGDKRRPGEPNDIFVSESNIVKAIKAAEADRKAAQSQ